jgi:hypothetical protein
LAALAKVHQAIADKAQAIQRRAANHSGCIDWLLEDEACEPYGWEIRVRVYYDWVKRSAGDHVTPAFGGYAEIADIDVLSVRYFNARHDAVSASQNHRDQAWSLIAKDASRIEDICTEAGRRSGFDHASQGVSLQQSLDLRFAKSASVRSSEERKRASG